MSNEPVVVDTYPEQEEYFEQLAESMQTATRELRKQTGLPPTFSDFLHEKVGKNWVVFARRTNRIVERYGDDVVVITPKRFERLEKEYEAQTGRKAY